MIIRGYLGRSTLATTAAITGILLAVFISNRFVNYLADAVAGTVSGKAILVLLSLKIPFVLGQLLPLALLLALLTVFGRLNRDNEMIILYMSGVEPRRFLGWTAALSAPIGLLVLVLVFWVAPWAAQKAAAVTEQEKSTAALRNIQPGRFTELGGGRGIFYAESLSDRSRGLENVFAARVVGGPSAPDQERIGVLVSGLATYAIDKDTGDQLVVMLQGHRYEGAPGERAFDVMEFERYVLRVPQQSGPFIPRRAEAHTTEQLWRNRDNPVNAAELHWRLALVLSVPLLALMSYPVSRSRPRQGRFARLVPGILVYLVYFNLLLLSRAWTEAGVIPGAVGSFWVHGLMLALVLVLLPGRAGWSRGFRALLASRKAPR